MTVLATVRNTGTHTCQNILSPLGEMHYLTEDPRRDNRYWFGHAEAKNLQMIREHCEAEPPLVLSMRNPVDCARSWVRRSKIIDRSFRALWTNLFTLKDEIKDSFWLPVDTPDRDNYLDALEARLGVELNRDWTRKGVFTAQSYSWSGGMTVEEASDWLKTLPFDQFGYQ